MDAPAPHQRVFVNRNLRMDTVKAVGWDMDYTLARYHRQRLEELAHRLTVEKLIERGYPERLRDITYDPNLVVRGLTVDKATGNILKLDRHHHVGKVLHGRRPLSKKERRALYRREKMRFRPPRFAMVDTLFALPEMCLYANLVDMLGKDPDHHLDTWRLFDDTRECIDECHRDGTLKSIVMNDLPTYVERDPLLARTLHKLRSSGKKMFLLTNSYWEYTNAVMTYLLDGEMSEYSSWRSYFDAVIVGGRKPGFFVGEEPMAELDMDTGQVLHREVTQLERGRVYQGGNLRQFEQAMKVGGEEVLYVGDHIYGDILSSKKSSLWRAALVVEELEDEISRAVEHHEDIEALAELEYRRRELDNLTNIQRQRLSSLDRNNPQQAEEYQALKRQRDISKRELREVLREMDRRQGALDRVFNPIWGMVFKMDRENSRFGDQVTDYACIYTSRVTNLLFYSAHQYFRSPRDFMPHERTF